MEMSLDKSVPKILIALSLQCNSPDCRECPYWELDNCKEAVKRDAAALIKLLLTDLDLVAKERDAAVEVITCLSIATSLGLKNYPGLIDRLKEREIELDKPQMLPWAPWRIPRLKRNRQDLPKSWIR